MGDVAGDEKEGREARVSETSAWPGEVCKRCLRRNCIGFRVEDLVWAKVAGALGVLCTTCFDELAEGLGVSYRFLEVFPVSWSDWRDQA